MLPRINRIKKKKDFETIFKKGRSFKNNLFVLRFINNHLDYNRVGIVVSQKVSKKATARNKVRRRLVEIVKTFEKTVQEKYNLSEKKKKGMDLVMIALPEIEKKEFTEIKESLNGALLKIKF